MLKKKVYRYFLFQFHSHLRRKVIYEFSVDYLLELWVFLIWNLWIDIQPQILNINYYDECYIHKHIIYTDLNIIYLCNCSTFVSSLQWTSVYLYSLTKYMYSHVHNYCAHMPTLCTYFSYFANFFTQLHFFNSMSLKMWTWLIYCQESMIWNNRHWKLSLLAKHRFTCRLCYLTDCSGTVHYYIWHVLYFLVQLSHLLIFTC